MKGGYADPNLTNPTYPHSLREPKRTPSLNQKQIKSLVVGIGLVVPDILKMKTPKNTNAQKPVMPWFVTVVLASGCNAGNSLTVAREPQAKNEEVHKPIKKPQTN